MSFKSSPPSLRPPSAAPRLYAIDALESETLSAIRLLVIVNGVRSQKPPGALRYLKKGSFYDLFIRPL